MITEEEFAENLELEKGKIKKFAFFEKDSQDNFSQALSLKTHKRSDANRKVELKELRSPKALFDSVNHIINFVLKLETNGTIAKNKDL